MEVSKNDKHNPFVVYGSLVVAIAAVITSMADYKLAHDPGARPLPFTSKDGERHNVRISELEKYRISHTKWGYELQGKNEAERRELYRRLDAIEERLDELSAQIRFYHQRRHSHEE